MNISNNSLCNQVTLANFGFCYSYFASQKVVQVMFEITMGLCTGFANAFSFYKIYKKPVKVCFDYIFITSAITDFCIGSINLPFYHLKSLLNYWPFGTGFCAVWASFDQMLNNINILNMLFLSFCRHKSVTSPKVYHNNILIKYTPYVCTTIWATCFIFWFSVCFSYFFRFYQGGNCVLVYNPSILKSLVTFTCWFVPLIIIIIFNTNVLILINFKKIRKNVTPNIINQLKIHVFKENVNESGNNNPSNSVEISSSNYFRKPIKYIKSKMHAQTKLTIIVLVYLAQWFPSCFMQIINSLCDSCISTQVEGTIYWLTFSVSLTNPLCLILLSPDFIKKQQP